MLDEDLKTGNTVVFFPTDRSRTAVSGTFVCHARNGSTGEIGFKILTPLGWDLGHSTSVWLSEGVLRRRNPTTLELSAPVEGPKRFVPLLREKDAAEKGVKPADRKKPAEGAASRPRPVARKSLPFPQPSTMTQEDISLILESGRQNTILGVPRSRIRAKPNGGIVRH